MVYPVTRRASTKDALEALGAPHTEVWGLLANGSPCGFERLLAPGDRVDAFGADPPVDVTAPHPLRPPPLPGLRFLVDANVNRLGRLLRLLGLDAAGDPRLDDADLAERAERESRVLLTRDRGLCRRKRVGWARLLRANHPHDQLRETLRFFGLKPPFSAFTRCLDCNERLEPVDKARVLDRLEPKTRLYYHEFRLCPACGKVFWAGSHHQAMLHGLADLVGELGA